MVRSAVLTAAFSIALAAQVAADPPLEHESRFEFTEAFIRDVWVHPIETLGVTLKGEGPVHTAQDDCEIHIGAELDDTSIGDFQAIVLEPPGVCHDPRKTKTAWRAFYHSAADKHCQATGFIRVWPEHLDAGQGASNPAHVMELHPLRDLSCDGGFKIDVREPLKPTEDLGYKDAAVIDSILESFRLWVRRTTNGDAAEATTVAFDYLKCDARSNCSNRGPVPNFARFSAKILNQTARCSTGGPAGEEFKSVLARVQPIGMEEEVGPRWRMTKLYALKGSDFFTALGPCSGDHHATPVAKTFDLIGIFTVDPLAVVKVLQKNPDSQDWTEVPFPIAFIVFGKTVLPTE